MKRPSAQRFVFLILYLTILFLAGAPVQAANSLPTITCQPADLMLDAGGSAQFVVCATNAPPLSFQWQHNAQLVPGGTATFLLLQNVSSNDAGQYRCVITNSAGAVTSAVATLTVLYRAPLILIPPASQVVWVDDDASANFACSVAGGPPPSLQWLFNGLAIANQTNSALRFSVYTTNRAGSYSLVASNVYGVVTSAVAQLTVRVNPPSGFYTQPVSCGVVIGNDTAFYVNAQGYPYPVYQWKHNGQDISGATASSLLIVNATANDAGDYQVVASNEGGSLTSVVARLAVSPPGPLDHWEWRHPLPQGNDLLCAAYGGDTFVALGKYGARIRSSTQGLSWQSYSQGNLETHAVAYGNGMFVALGTPRYGVYQNQALLSTDGVHWDQYSLSVSNVGRATALAFGNGRFVAVTVLDKVLVSTNGINWVVPEASDLPGFYHITFGNGLFLGTSYSMYNTNWSFNVALSSDGITWTNHNVFSRGSLLDLTYGNGRFALCGFDTNIHQTFTMVSVDGVTWETADDVSVSYFAKMAFGGGRFLMTATNAGGQTTTSENGVDWLGAGPGPSNNVMALTWGGGKFLAVGDKGGLFTSTNGANWAACSPGSPLNLRAMARGNNVSVAVGNEGLILASSNGLPWTRLQAPTTNNLRGVAFGNGRFVAVGEASLSGAFVFTSTDGFNWTPNAESSPADLYNVAYGKGLFVGVGASGAIRTSLDGESWSVRYPGISERLNAITFNGDRFVAVGRGGTIVTSTNGTNWDRGISTDNFFLQGVAYGNGMFVAGGQSGRRLISTNGVDWTNPYPNNNLPSYLDIEDVQFANGVFVIVGDNGFLATSTDGVLWTEHITPCQNSLRSSFYTGSSLMAVGNNETILQSDFFGRAILQVRSPLTAEGFEFAIDSQAGATYRLQASEDLVHWDDIFTFSNTRETTLYLDTEALSYSQRFYRVVSP